MEMASDSGLSAGLRVIRQRQPGKQSGPPLPPPTCVVVKLGVVRGPSEAARQEPWRTATVR